MGNELSDKAAEFESMMGLGDDASSDNGDTDTKEENEGDGDAVTVVDDATPPTVVSADDESEVVREIVKIDLQIEELSAKSVDEAAFYDNLDKELSEEEQALEFEDKSAYMKLVAKKAKEYVAKNSPSEEIATLTEKKEELIRVQERQGALKAIVGKYPSFSYETIFDFFENKLTKEQQEAIYAESKTYYDVYEKAYLKFADSNKMNIHQQKAPTIPNVNNVRKQELTDQSIDDNLTSHEQRLKDALGF